MLPGIEVQPMGQSLHWLWLSWWYRPCVQSLQVNVEPWAAKALIVLSCVQDGGGQVFVEVVLNVPAEQE